MLIFTYNLINIKSINLLPFSLPFLIRYVSSKVCGGGPGFENMILELEMLSIKVIILNLKDGRKASD